MKILNAAAIREWDQYTIQHEPISSLQLMERAAASCVEWMKENNLLSHSFVIFCGKGNNGGDGLAIARMLAEQHCLVEVCILEFGHKGTDDFQANLQRLHEVKTEIRFIQSAENFHPFKPGDIIIDALFGSGLNRPLEGVTAGLVEHINRSGCPILSIDIPSGLPADQSSKGYIAIEAAHTLSFQCYKPAFLVAENARYTGLVHILDIGLHPEFYKSLAVTDELLDISIIQSVFKPRNRFSHKGNFGHALLVAGSHGKMGAAVLAAKACLRSGAGLLTCHLPATGCDIMQVSLPEAMVEPDIHPDLNTQLGNGPDNYNAIGIGPGIGTAPEIRLLLEGLFQAYRRPLVIDADALNAIASNTALLSHIPAGSILTPHPKEFERLFGSCDNDFQRIEKAREKAMELNIVIVLKGHHTFIASPAGHGFFNSTGNAGMATAGSGDTLTGILTGLLAQGYPSIDVAKLGVFIHGLAGDYAADEKSMESMIAGDIIDNLGKAFWNIQSKTA